MNYTYENILKKNIYISNKINNLLLVKKYWYSIPNGFIIKYCESNINSLDLINIKKYIIRSCLSIEDGQNSSFAWLYPSLVFNYKKHTFSNNLLKTYKSISFDDIELYKNYFNISVKEKIFFLIQEFIYWDYSWVYFSNYEWNEVIEYVKSTNSILVDWQVTSSKVFINNNNYRFENNIQEYFIDLYWKKVQFNKKIKIKSKLFEELLSTLRNIKKRFSYEVDIEWTINKWKIFILQVRSITI